MIVVRGPGRATTGRSRWTYPKSYGWRSRALSTTASGPNDARGIRDRGLSETAAARDRALREALLRDLLTQSYPAVDREP